jgi:RNA polymerase sigma-70 factor (ECF subfamily)
LTAERVYERRWALTLLERALGRLRAECTGAGRDELYEPLKEVLTGEARAVSYAQAGLALRVTEAAVKMAVHRLRKRYREILREEISHTVANPAEVDEEIRYLFVALG